MNWNVHYQLRDKHSFLSASKYHWINYDPDKLVQAWNTYEAASIGTELHALAAKLIDMGIKLPKTKKTLNLYVNDGIGYKMKTEQVLYYSDNAFGTADTIAFRKDPKTGRNFLRIHDLKTGTIPAHMEQLLIYAAYFCLEYGFKPRDIDIELRIYQNDEVLIHNAFNEFKEEVTGYDMIEQIIKKVIAYDKIIDELKGMEG